METLQNPRLEEPIKDPARFPWHEVTKVAHYWLEVDAMTAPDAAGQRLITAGTFLWLSEVAAILREQLGPAARKVPRRRVPNMLVRALALFEEILTRP